MHLEGLAETPSKGDGTGAPFPANREGTRSRETRVSFKSRCEGLWLPGEAVGGLRRSGPLSQLPGGRSWDLRSGGQLGGGEQWPAEMERAGQNRTPRAAGCWGGGGRWTSSRGRGLLGQVSRQGRRAHPLGGFRSARNVGSGPWGTRLSWAPSPWKQRGLMGRHDAATAPTRLGRGSPAPLSSIRRPRRGTSLFKSPAFLLPHRTRGLRTNPLGYGHLPKETPGWTHCVSLDLAPVCSPRPQVTPWAAAGAAFPEAGAWAGHAAWVLGVGGETLRLQRRGARTRGAAHGRVPGPHPAPRRVYSAPGPAPCPAPFPPTALARPAP